jgi:hypothetical protein
MNPNYELNITWEVTWTNILKIIKLQEVNKYSGLTYRIRYSNTELQSLKGC